MADKRGSRHILRRVVLLVTAVMVPAVAAACAGRSADPLLTGAGSRSAATLTPGEVNLVIRPRGGYQIGGEDSAFGEQQLPQRLGAAYSRVPGGPRTLNIYAYEGVVGYEVLMALNAARNHGVKEVRGVADYGDSRLSRLNWKRWEMKLNSAPPRPSRPDTLRRRPEPQRRP